MIVYIDVLIITNFIINYLLLKATQRISNSQYNSYRIIFSAFIGSIFSFVIFFDIESNLLLFLIKIAAIFINIMIAFGYINKYYFTKNIVSLFVANFILIGLILAIRDNKVVFIKNNIAYFNVNPIVLVVITLTAWVMINLYTAIFNKKTIVKNIEFKIIIRDNSFKIKGFYDSGFLLKDIVSNRNIILIDYNYIKKYLTIEQKGDIEHFYNTGIQKGKTVITPLFYNTINGSDIMPAIRVDKIEIISENKIKELKKCIIALSKNELSQEIHMIYGKEILNIIED